MSEDSSSRGLAELQAEIHRCAVEHGWWEPQPTKGQELATTEDEHGTLLGHEVLVSVQRSFGELVALMHSELSEALEAFRDSGLESWHECAYGGDRRVCTTPDKHDCKDRKPEGAFVELADCIIRILDTAGYYGVDMESLIREKMAYNETRPYRHGNKRI